MRQRERIDEQTAGLGVDEHETVRDESVGYTRVERAPWSPAQVFVLAAGLLLTIMGGIALARTGLAFDHIPSTRTQVAGLHHTSLSAIIELGVGVVLLGVGALPGSDRGPMAFFGAGLLGAGIVIAVQPGSFHRWLGYNQGNGVLFAVIGAVLLLATMASPVVSSGRRSVGHRVDDRRGNTIGHF